MWTKFIDMCSGGSEKLGASTIWIEAEKGEAIDLFERIFDRDPHNVTCGCCGPDYLVYEDEPEIEAGDWVVTAEDIARFKAGHRLPVANAELNGARRASDLSAELGAGG